MKRISILMLLALLIIFKVNSQSNCSTYYPVSEGATFKYKNYNKKGKTDGTTSYRILESITEEGKTVANISFQIKDLQGKSTFRSEYNITCNGDMTAIGFKSLLHPSFVDGYQDSEMDITGTNLELPNTLNVGQKLPDANVSVKVNVVGIKMNATVEITNRRVVRKNNLRTAAGKFDCFVIFNDNYTNAGVLKQKFQTQTWYAEGVGIVKQVTYGKRGKLVSKMQLNKYSK
jgi:hypothetical protein